MPIVAAAGFAIAGASGVHSYFDGRLVNAYLQIGGEFSTVETVVANISFPRVSPVGFVFRGAVNATGSRVCVVHINNAGRVTVQAQETFTGNVYFSFCAILGD